MSRGWLKKNGWSRQEAARHEDKMGDRLIGGEGSCGVSEVKMLT